MFKVGDKVKVVASYAPDYGKIYVVMEVDNREIVWAGIEGTPRSWCGGYHQSGAGYLGNYNDPPMIRLITPLEQVL